MCFCNWWQQALASENVVADPLKDSWKRDISQGTHDLYYKWKEWKKEEERVHHQLFADSSDPSVRVYSTQHRVGKTMSIWNIEVFQNIENCTLAWCVTTGLTWQEIWCKLGMSRASALDIVEVWVWRVRIQGVTSAGQHTNDLKSLRTDSHAVVKLVVRTSKRWKQQGSVSHH